jgi:hypothetical protein
VYCGWMGGRGMEIGRDMERERERKKIKEEKGEG